MKCIRLKPAINKNTEIIRVTDSEAKQKVKNEGYVYVNKSMWKHQVRSR